MLKRIGIGLVLGAAVAAAGAMVVVQAFPEPVTLSRPPAGDKPFARICKSDEALDARPTPAWVGASFANDNCRAPKMPALVDGFAASREQVVASMNAAKHYVAASDAFERCVQNFVASRKAQAGKSGKPVSMSLIVIENHRITASQRNRKLASARVNTVINKFNEYGSECPS
jgi:hypothetical protein